MLESIALDGVGITKGICGNGFQYYHVLGKDESDQQFLITFGVKQCYTESAEKTFKRMFAVGIPTPSEELHPVPEEKKELSEYEKLLLED